MDEYLTKTVQVIETPVHGPAMIFGTKIPLADVIEDALCSVRIPDLIEKYHLPEGTITAGFHHTVALLRSEGKL